MSSKKHGTLWTWLAFTCLCAFLTGCTARLQNSTDAVLRLLSKPSNANVATQLDPSYKYLRVSVFGQTGFLALGYTDAHPMGSIDVWYSSDYRVLRIQNGYIVGISGTPVEWRQVIFSTKPHWPTGGITTKFTRTRDVMPGYKFGITDQLTLTEIVAPKTSNYATNPHIPPIEGLQWFEATDASQAITPSRFAVATINNTPTAVYGEQCFAEDFCITWQTWPLTPLGQVTKP
jgi:hypothetical protein